VREITAVLPLQYSHYLQRDIPSPAPLTSFLSLHCLVTYMEALEERKYHTIILGTDTTLSILSAYFPPSALARSGQKVLHLDSCEYYGGADASLTLPEFLAFMSAGDQPPFVQKEVLVSPPTSPDFQSLSRKFVIDLQPRLQYGAGSAVELMVQGGVSQYLEFKPVTTGVMWLGDRFQQIPSDHQDVLRDERLTAGEKAALLLLVDKVSRMTEYQGTFQALVQESGLTPFLQNVLLHGILLQSEPAEELTVAEAAERIKVRTRQKHVASLNLYRKDSPMLYPLFGSSDISQAFCRLAAVFGATYVVTPSVTLGQIATLPTGEVTISTSLGLLECDRIIASPKYHYLNPTATTTVLSQYLRSVTISTQILYPSDVPVLLSIPPSTLSPLPVFILQITNATSCVPADFALYYCWTRVSDYSQGRTALDQVQLLIPGEIILRAIYTQNVQNVTTTGGITVINDLFRGIDIDFNIVSTT